MPDVKAVDVNYDDAGALTVSATFYDDTRARPSTWYATEVSVIVGQTKITNGRADCDSLLLPAAHYATATVGFNRGRAYASGSVAGFEGSLTTTPTLSADGRVLTAVFTNSALARRSYECVSPSGSTWVISTPENLYSRYDAGCDCWYVYSTTSSDGLARFWFSGSEPPTAPACNNGIDDDGDGKTDYPSDLGCSSYTGISETNPMCNDGIDNDGDGKIDYPEDTTCTTSSGTTEGPPRPACSNNRDDDGDGKTDQKDPGCRGKSSGTSETDPPPVRSVFKLSKLSPTAQCGLDVTVDVLPDLKPVKVFTFRRISLTVKKISGPGRNYQSARKLPLSESSGYHFKTGPGRFRVSGYYLGDAFRKKSRQATRTVTVCPRKLA